MRTLFSGKKLSSILCVLPQEESLFDDEVENYSFPVNQTMRLKKIMGYEKHRLAKATSAVSDFAVFGLRYMLENKWIQEDEIGAIVTVTLCPDHFVPHIGNIVQSKLLPGAEIMCIDIAQGCCGFLIGMFETFMLLEHLGDKKAILINGDVLSHKVSRRDRNDFPLIGDGAAISVIENDAAMNRNIYYEQHMDGARGDALKIPAGGFRMPSTPETAKVRDTLDGNYRSLDHIHMDGASVFDFVQTEVPPMLERIFREVEPKDSFDYFLFHQPNRFMLRKLAESAELPEDRLPMNLVENYGNLSGACIPFVAAMNIGDSLRTRSARCCLSAFGSGLSWGAMLMDIGPLEHCEIIESNL